MFTQFNFSVVLVGDGTGSYILKNIGSEESGTKEGSAAKYSIALQYLVLEEISC
jgi:hypothetical protein